jgi:hypothetical protein
MRCTPAVSDDVVKVACPKALSVPVPIVVVSSSNVTVPVGVPVPLFGVTVAVKVTDWPNVLGFGDEVRFVSVCRRAWADAVVDANPIAHITAMASAPQHFPSRRPTVRTNAPAAPRHNSSARLVC